MNDDFQSFESDLAKVQPARMTRQQRQRLHHRIAVSLSEHTEPKHLTITIHWLKWCGTAAAAALVAIMVATSSRPVQPRVLEGMQLASSNTWEVQEHSLGIPVSSNVRENEFYISNSYSNLPQAMARKT